MDLSRENKNVKICFNHTQYTEHFIHSLNHVYHITWQMYFHNVYGSKESCDTLE